MGDQLGLVEQWVELVIQLLKYRQASQKTQTVDVNVFEMTRHSPFGKVDQCLLSCWVSAGEILEEGVAMESLGLEGSGAC